MKKLGFYPAGGLIGRGKVKVKRWNWTQANKVVVKNGRARTRKAAEALAAAVRAKCPVGTVSHPMYKTGKFAGQPWTKRDGGSLKRSVRVTEKKENYGIEAMQHTGLGIVGGARVYCGNYFAWYAAIVEFYQPFIKPTAASMQGQIKSILENG